MKDPWSPVDPLGEALHSLRMSATFYCRSEFTAPWALALPVIPDTLMFHVVTSGRCRLEVDGAADAELATGDLALVPHGLGHRLASEPGVAAAKLFELPREQVSERLEILRHGGGGEPTTVVCGAVHFADPGANRLLALLPRRVCVATGSSTQKEWIDSTLRFMAAESSALQPGGETIVTRLADVLVILAIRAWLAQEPAARTGWLGALQDRQVGRAIAFLHRYPDRSWTLASLASEAAMSRSAFAARFRELVGEPAMRYLARFRMQAALIWLKEEDVRLAEVASRMGYRSEAAFNRAFKRVMGVPPGVARQGGDEAPG